MFSNNWGTKAAKIQPSSCTALQVTDLNDIIGKQPHNFFRKFTYSDRCELFGKSLQQKLTHRQEGACSSGKVSCITDRSQLNVHRLDQMTVRYVMCSFTKIPFMGTDIQLTKYFDLQVHSL